MGTNRDAWVYNFSRNKLLSNVQATVGFYNLQVAEFQAFIAKSGITKPTESDVKRFVNHDSTKISWSSSLIPKVARSHFIRFDKSRVRDSMYRPFNKQKVYFDGDMNHRVAQLPKMFPTPELGNIGFYVPGPGPNKAFSVLMIDLLPCLDLFAAGQFFPLYTYEPLEGKQLSFGEELGSGYRRVENITDDILADYRKAYGSGVAKDDIFYYVYGVLHSPEYCVEFESDLKKMLPRVPKVKDFKGFSLAGRKLAQLHLNYETVEPYPVTEAVHGGEKLSDYDKYRVQKMSFGPNKDRSTIFYNHMITLTGVPDEAYRYMLGSRSALELVIDRYQVSTHPASQIENDPNDWCVEVGNPRYILDLVKSIITVSVETMKIVDSLPKLTIIDGPLPAAASAEFSDEFNVTEAAVDPR